MVPRTPIGLVSLHGAGLAPSRAEVAQKPIPTPPRLDPDQVFAAARQVNVMSSRAAQDPNMEATQ
jgi:hypothetical protein